MKRAAELQLAKPQKIPSDCKRRRDDKDVVTIAGVPSGVSAALVDAIRKTKSYFKHHSKDIIPPRLEDDIVEANSIRSHQSESVVSAILDRIEQSKSIESRRKEERRREKMINTMHSWLGALEKEKGGDPENSPAVGCLLYAWKLQEHEFPIVRRTSLHICGSLLLKDTDCRSSWKDCLLKWTSSLTDLKHISEKYCEEMAVWQQEGRKWMSAFSTRFPNDNKFQVALMCIEQRIPLLNGNNEIVYNGKNMADLRRIRDIAMKHGQKQCKIVEKMLQRSYAYMNVLMPRIGLDDQEQINGEDAVSYPEQECAKNVNEDDDDDDNDGVDWEEGDDDAAAETHAAAVEQTLALMYSTGGLQGGNVEIKLNGHGDGKNTNQRVEHAKEKLQKIVSLLSTKHLPCLSTWVNSLSQSDNLLLKNGALVMMCSKGITIRQDLTKHLIHVKRNIASVLSAASQLKIKAEESSKLELRKTTPGHWSHAYASRRHVTLTCSIDRRGKAKMSNEVTKRRSNRIQIKFNKK
mmetsp:Transcript_12/g.15  ORF Transcript_12/g.15 Transcript_12/m.15 type:complete len:520 (+) Transcript_12:65-1624(+)